MALVPALALALAVTGAVACDKKENAPSAAPSGSASAAAPAASSAAPAGPQKLTRDTVVWKWTGKTDAEGYPLMSITNNGPAALTHALLQYYFYDKSGKQLERKQFEFYSINLAMGATTEVGRGSKKADWPAGTDAIEVEVQRADFMGNIAMVDLSLAPETRPKGGVK